MTNTSIISQTQMGKILEQELAASEQLMQLLAAEKMAITDRDIPAFEKAVELKRLLLERLAQYEQERIQLLERGGIKHNPRAMYDYIQESHDNNRLSDLWQRLLSKAADCRDHNRQNHLLVELLSAHTNRALRVLRGEPMEQKVYGPDGDTNEKHENRSLAIA